VHAALRPLRGLPVDYDEPRRVAGAAAAIGLEYAVITSVNRDRPVALE
jgi:lipoate synthase